MDNIQYRFLPIQRFIQWIDIFYQKNKWLLIILTLTGLSLWAGYRFAWATDPHGIGVRSDSVAYFWSADSLIKGIGLGRITVSGDFKPMTHWPPLYPLLLSLFELVGIPALDGARWLGIFLFGVVVFLTGLTIARFTRSFWFSLAGAFILSICPGFWETSLYAMTEPLYLVLYLAAVLMLDQFLLSGRWKWLVACAVVLAGCFLTRYIGFTLVGAIALVILLRKDQPFKQRLIQTATLAGISIFPILLWMIRNAIQGGSATNRSLNFFPILPGDFHLAWETFKGWFAPNDVIFQVGFGKIIVVVITLSLFFVFKLTLKKVQSETYNYWIPICSGIYIVLYGFGVLGSRLFLDPLITFFEQRIVFMIYPALLFLIIFIFHWIFEKAQQRSIYLGAALLVGFILVFYSYVVGYQPAGQHFIDNSRDIGLGFMEKSLKNSCLAPSIKDLPVDYHFYTDNLERLYFFTHRNPDQINNVDFVVQLSHEPTGHGIVFVMFNKDEVTDKVVQQFPNARQICQAPLIEVVPPTVN